MIVVGDDVVGRNLKFSLFLTPNFLDFSLRKLSKTLPKFCTLTSHSFQWLRYLGVHIEAQENQKMARDTKLARQSSCSQFYGVKCSIYCILHGTQHILHFTTSWHPTIFNEGIFLPWGVRLLMFLSILGFWGDCAPLCLLDRATTLCHALGACVCLHVLVTRYWHVFW